MSTRTLVEKYKVIELLTPAADAGGRTSDYVSLKNAQKETIVFHVAQGNAATIALALLQASDVAATGSKALSAVQKIWANEDCATSDTLVRQTDAASFTTSAAVKHKQVVFEIDPSTLDIANGFDCIAMTTGASNAGNVTSAQIFIETRYPQATPPAGITD